MVSTDELTEVLVTLFREAVAHDRGASVLVSACVAGLVIEKPLWAFELRDRAPALRQFPALCHRRSRFAKQSRHFLASLAQHRAAAAVRGGCDLVVPVSVHVLLEVHRRPFHDAVPHEARAAVLVGPCVQRHVVVEALRPRRIIDARLRGLWLVLIVGPCCQADDIFDLLLRHLPLLRHLAEGPSEGGVIDLSRPPTLYTGEDEIRIHGGEVLVEQHRVLEALHPRPPIHLMAPCESLKGLQQRR
mmetsp:Transcript_149316/g.212275  ORF Transcript_149316/g.212275 Transcript_149316/m.212275 type:complete len:245 (+) Transcript_149316:684-1418(+)